MRRQIRSIKHSRKVRVTTIWLRVFSVTASLLFSGWFFYAIYAERNQGATTDRIGGSAEISTRLREDARDWFRRHFPESAARAAENYGIFQYEGTGDIETADEWILLAHGLDEPGNIWGNLAPVLDAGGYRVLEFCYPNDQAIHESARFLADQMSALLAADFETRPSGIHLIGHSMGGLVLRDFLTHEALYPQATWKDNTPVRSLIQIATPNHGSWLATYRLPAELRDHLFKDFGPDAILNMIWDGTGVAQIDLKPESSFLTNLNFRPFPKNIYWVGIAGIGSPVNLASLKDGLVDKLEDLSDSAHSLNDTFPELFKGTGDGCVSIDSLRCEEMDEVFLVEATHRNIIRSPRGSTPPAIPIVMELLSSGQL